MSSEKSSRENKLDLISSGWDDYQLLDSGNQQKLERFGVVQLVRFEPEAIWKPALPNNIWNQSDAVYSLFSDSSKGGWKISTEKVRGWCINYDQVTFSLSITDSRHIGIFPEQQPNWNWLGKTITDIQKPIKILNLFAYTGGTTLIATRSGSYVTHVDASRSAIQQTRKNLLLSNLDHLSVRLINDDALQFVQREIRRGNKYDGIILDPPAFGRGPKRQVWKFEKSLPELLNACSQILTSDPSLLLLTAYNINNSIVEIKDWVTSILRLPAGRIEYGDVNQKEKSAGRMIKQAVYLRWRK